jgi:hypothetical protein
MKKLAITLTAAALFFAASSFTVKGDNIPGKVKTAFEKDFVAAANAAWEKNENLYYVTFSWNSSDVKAVFNADGDLLNTSRKISIAQLPLKVTLAVQQKFKGYQLEDNAAEIVADDETTYRLAVSNGTKEIRLSSNASGDITVN